MRSVKSRNQHNTYGKGNTRSVDNERVGPYKKLMVKMNILGQQII